MDQKSISTGSIKVPLVEPLVEKKSTDTIIEEDNSSKPILDQPVALIAMSLFTIVASIALFSKYVNKVGNPQISLKGALDKYEFCKKEHKLAVENMNENNQLIISTNEELKELESNVDEFTAEVTRTENAANKASDAYQKQKKVLKSQGEYKGKGISSAVKGNLNASLNDPVGQFPYKGPLTQQDENENIEISMNKDFSCYRKKEGPGDDKDLQIES